MRLVGEPRAGHPEDPRRAHRVGVEIARRDLHVRRLRVAVEDEARVVRRIELAEDDGGRQVRIGADEARVHAEALDRRADVAVEHVVADARDQGDGAAEPGARDGDVRGGAADRLRERAHVGDRAGLLGVDVDPDPPHRDEVEGRGAHQPARCARLPASIAPRARGDLRALARASGTPIPRTPCRCSTPAGPCGSRSASSSSALGRARAPPRARRSWTPPRRRSRAPRRARRSRPARAPRSGSPRAGC